MKKTKEILAVILTIILLISSSINVYATEEPSAIITLDIENVKVGETYKQGEEIIVAVKIDVENMVGITALNAETINYDHSIISLEEIILPEGWEFDVPGLVDQILISRKDLDDVPSGSIVCRMKFKALVDFRQTDISLEVIDVSDTNAVGALSILDQCNEPTFTIKPKEPAPTMNYKVEHYKQTESGYTLAETENLTGTIGTTVTASPKAYSGYVENTTHADRVATGILAEGQNLVLKLYYDINKPTNTTMNYKVEHYKQNQGISGYTLAETENLTGTIGTTVTASPKAYSGYVENTTHADRVATGTLVEGQELVLKLYYDINEAATIKYKVEHYKQTELGYILADIDELFGQNEQEVTAVAKTYEGYVENTTHADRLATGKLVEGQELVLKLYYDVNQFTVTFKDGQNTLKVEKVLPGKNATAPTISKAGYTLSWDKSFTNVTEDIIVNAVWTKNKVEDDGKEETPSQLPQTGDIAIKAVTVISVITLLGFVCYIKYKKVKEI